MYPSGKLGTYFLFQEYKSFTLLVCLMLYIKTVSCLGLGLRSYLWKRLQKYLYARFFFFTIVLKSEFK